MCFSLFLFNDTATTEIYTLSLHDALPIWSQSKSFSSCARIGRIFSFSASSPLRFNSKWTAGDRKSGSAGMPRPISYAVFCLKKKKEQKRKKLREKQRRNSRELQLPQRKLHARNT